MMRSPAVGLLWEEWRRSSRLAIATAGVTITGAVFLASRDRFGPWQSSLIYEYVSLGAAIGFVLYLLVSQSAANAIQVGIPARRFRLPVSNGALVFWPLMYRVTVTALIIAVNSLAAWCLFDAKAPYLLESGCFLVGIAIYAHLLAWSGQLLGKWTTVLGWFAIIYPGLGLIDWYSRLHWIESPARELAFPLMVLAIALPVIVGAVARIRSGSLGFWQNARTFARDEDRSRRTEWNTGLRYRQKPFPFPLVAQVWFEWRAIGRKMAVVLCCPTCAMMSILMPIAALQGKFVPYLTAWFLMALIAIPAGLWVFAKTETSSRRDSARLIHALPVDDRTLDAGRLGAAALTIFSSFVFVAVFSTIVWHATRAVLPGVKPVALDADPSAVSGIAMFFLFAGFGWLAYTRGGFITCVFFGAELANEAVGSFVPDISNRLQNAAGDLPWIIHAALIVLAVEGAVVNLRAYYEGAVSRRTLAASGIACLVIAVAYHFLLRRPMSMAFDIPVAEISRITTAAWALAFALAMVSPLPIAALRTRRLRHP